MYKWTIGDGTKALLGQWGVGSALGLICFWLTLLAVFPLVLWSLDPSAKDASIIGALGMVNFMLCMKALFVFRDDGMHEYIKTFEQSNVTMIWSAICAMFCMILMLNFHAVGFVVGGFKVPEFGSTADEVSWYLGFVVYLITIAVFAIAMFCRRRNAALMEVANGLPLHTFNALKLMSGLQLVPSNEWNDAGGRFGVVWNAKMFDSKRSASVFAFAKSLLLVSAVVVLALQVMASMRGDIVGLSLMIMFNTVIATLFSECLLVGARTIIYRDLVDLCNIKESEFAKQSDGEQRCGMGFSEGEPRL